MSSDATDLTILNKGHSALPEKHQAQGPLL
jgi:hypothetical protein